LVDVGDLKSPGIYSRTGSTPVSATKNFNSMKTKIVTNPNIPYDENSHNWYDKFIEDPLKDIVNYLRNNGINTECSCGHEGYIQCQYIPDGEISHLIHLLSCYFYENKIKKMTPNYTIEIKVKCIDGSLYPSIDIKLPKAFKKSKKEKITN